MEFALERSSTAKNCNHLHQKSLEMNKKNFARYIKIYEKWDQTIDIPIKPISPWPLNSYL